MTKPGEVELKREQEKWKAEKLYPNYLHQAWLIARMLEDVPLGEMIRYAEHAAAIGPIFDPTLYRENASKLDQDIRLLRALAAVKAEVAKMSRGD